MQGIQQGNSSTTSPAAISTTARGTNSEIATISTSLSSTNGSAQGNNTCRDLACASACSFSWVSWSSASASFLTAHADIVSTYTVVSQNGTSTYGYTLPSTGTAYATCDSYPRYKGNLGNASEISNVPISATSSTRYLLSTRIQENYTQPTPTCQIASKQCGTLQDEWHNDHYLPYPFNQSTGFWSNWWDGSPLDFPHCNNSYTTWINGSIYADSSGCWVKAATAKLFYWPEPDVVHDNTTCPPDTRVAPPLDTPAPNADPVTTVMTFSETYYNCCTTTMTLTSPTIYLSMQDVEGRNANWGFGGGGPIPATIVAVDPSELYSNEIAPPLITNAALSSSAMSVIANREWSKYTDLFGYNWEQHSSQFSGLGGPNAPLRSVPVNIADFGKPPPPLSYYYGAVGWYCLNQDPYALHNQPVSAGLPPMDCNTIYDDYYRPWIQIPEKLRNEAFSGCHPMFGWDPPIALTKASAIGPTIPGQAPATTTKQTPTTTSQPAGPASPPPAGTTPTAEPVNQPGTTQDPNPADPSTPDTPAQPTPSDPESTAGDSGDPGATGGDNPPSPASANNPAQGTPNGPASNNGGADNSPAPNDPASSNGDGGDSPALNTPVATIGTGSAAVTIAPDPSNLGGVIASSNGGAATFTPGQQGTVGGQDVSVGSSGQVVVSTTNTIAVGSLATAAGGQTVSADSSGNLIVDGQTVTPVTNGGGGGVAATTIAGTAFAVNSDGQIVVQSAGTFTAGAGVVPAFATTFRGQTISAVSDGVVINGETLTLGASATIIDGVAYSVDSDGQLVAAASTTLGGSGAAFTGTTTLGGEIVSSVSNGVVVDGHTITSGAAATTIDGHLYSLDSNGQLTVTSTIILGTVDGDEAEASGLIDALMSVAAAETTGSETAEPTSSAVGEGEGAGQQTGAPEGTSTGSTTNAGNRAVHGSSRWLAVSVMLTAVAGVVVAVL